MTSGMQNQGERAVVVGASIAGLLAGKALSEAYYSVLILDRDTLPAEAAPRKGVAQSYQPHILLVKGLDGFEELVPGFRETLVQAGGLTQRREDWHFVFLGGPLKVHRTDITVVGATRALIEHVLRQEIASTPNITIRTGIDVEDLVWDDEGAVTGVATRMRDDRAVEETIHASLVVDSSGRHSSITQWIGARGYDNIPEEVVNSSVGYSSRFYHRDAASAGIPNMLIQPRPPDNPRLGIMMAVEGDRWQVLLGGAFGHTPPSDEDGFLEWARMLASPELYDVIRTREPLTPIRGFRIPETRWRRFDKAERWPAGLVVVGDAVAAYNPIYGQGMSVAAIEAVALRKTAAERRPGWERAFQREVGKIAAFPWSTGSGEDLRWPGCTLNGKPAGLAQRLQYHYMDRLLRAATRDETVSRVFAETINLMHGPMALMSPGIVLRTLIHGFARSVRENKATVPSAVTEAIPR
jgi:2-polyprenyl-6-methoxyphenol hydroxylase-like FAD-dependent oxidoreductase